MFQFRLLIRSYKKYPLNYKNLDLSFAVQLYYDMDVCLTSSVSNKLNYYKSTEIMLKHLQFC